MKSHIRKMVPQFLLTRYSRFLRHKEQSRNKNRSIEEVFTSIYAENKWGGKKGEFSSGSGTENEAIVSPYIAMVSAKAASENFKGLTFVDLGCGDFRVGKQLLPLCSRYIGIDVVKPLIQHHQSAFGSEAVQFKQLDIVNDPLPTGDVCFIRQVFQHLSNHHISMVLPKLLQYRWAFITEHYPSSDHLIKPNLDKVHGGDIRVYENSGVYLTEPPFQLPKEAFEQVLEVAGSGLGDAAHAGVIRTFLYKPRR